METITITALLMGLVSLVLLFKGYDIMSVLALFSGITSLMFVILMNTVFPGEIAKAFVGGLISGLLQMGMVITQRHSTDVVIMGSFLVVLIATGLLIEGYLA